VAFPPGAYPRGFTSLNNANAITGFAYPTPAIMHGLAVSKSVKAKTPSLCETSAQAFRLMTDAKWRQLKAEHDLTWLRLSLEGPGLS